MALRDEHDYPITYKKTLDKAHEQVAVSKAIEVINDIEDRWVRLSTAEGYTFRDIKRDALLCDIRDLLKCSIVFINEIAKLEALLHHRAPSRKMIRQAKEIALPLE